MNLSKASVTSYLPYEKGVYFPAETDSNNLSVGAERIRRMWKRNEILEKLRIEQSAETLWAVGIEFQGYKFRTYSGLVFSYSLKKGRGDTYTKELFIDRRENSKNLWEYCSHQYREVKHIGVLYISDFHDFLASFHDFPVPLGQGTHWKGKPGAGRASPIS